MLVREVRGSATFDPTRRYRYRLTRRWARGPRVAFVMLDPNTADATKDDPTIRRCVGFARRWGFGSLVVVNLFGLCARHPRELARATDPVGPQNDRHVRRAVRSADLVVCAWGALPLARARARELDGAFGGPRLRCLGLTKMGAPRHPLYLRSDTRLRPFSGP
jgi:hypothetical protein